MLARESCSCASCPTLLLGSPRAAAIQSAFCRFTPEPLVADNTYRTFVLDLSPSIEELRKRLDKKWRNQLSSSEKNDLKVVAGKRVQRPVPDFLSDVQPDAKAQDVRNHSGR